MPYTLIAIAIVLLIIFLLLAIITLWKAALTLIAVIACVYFIIWYFHVPIDKVYKRIAKLFDNR